MTLNFDQTWEASRRLTQLGSVDGSVPIPIYIGKSEPIYEKSMQLEDLLEVQHMQDPVSGLIDAHTHTHTHSLHTHTHTHTHTLTARTHAHTQTHCTHTVPTHLHCGGNTLAVRD